MHSLVLGRTRFAIATMEPIDTPCSHAASRSAGPKVCVASFLPVMANRNTTSTVSCKPDSLSEHPIDGDVGGVGNDDAVAGVGGNDSDI